MTLISVLCALVQDLPRYNATLNGVSIVSSIHLLMAFGDALLSVNSIKSSRLSYVYMFSVTR